MSSKGQMLQDPFLEYHRVRTCASVYLSLVNGIKLQGPDQVVRSVR